MLTYPLVCQLPSEVSVRNVQQIQHGLQPTKLISSLFFRYITYTKLIMMSEVFVIENHQTS